MNTELLKEAASYLEYFKTANEELEGMVKKSELVEKIAVKLKNQCSDIDNFLEKIAELRTKNLEELENLNTYIEIYAPQAEIQFGKIAESNIYTMENSSPEELFAQNLMSNKLGGKF